MDTYASGSRMRRLSNLARAVILFLCERARQHNDEDTLARGIYVHTRMPCGCSPQRERVREKNTTHNSNAAIQQHATDIKGVCIVVYVQSRRLRRMPGVYNRQAEWINNPGWFHSIIWPRCPFAPRNETARDACTYANTALTRCAAFYFCMLPRTREHAVGGCLCGFKTIYMLITRISTDTDTNNKRTSAAAQFASKAARKNTLQSRMHAHERLHSAHG